MCGSEQDRRVCENGAIDDKTVKIRALNDGLRKYGVGGRWMMTQGLSQMDRATLRSLVIAVREFSDFDHDNDPYGEHDFGAVDVAEQRFFWKIDYYDLNRSRGSEEPSDPSCTQRILTVMHSWEY